MTKSATIAVSFLALCLTPLAAQSTEHESAAGRRETAVNLRAWIFPLDLTQAVSVSAASDGADWLSLLASSKDGVAVSAAGYTQIPPGKIRIDLKSGEEVLAAKPWNLREAAHYTVLAWNDAGRWEMQIFEDDLSSARTAERPLRVLNFARGRETTLALDDGEEIPVAKDAVREMKVPGQVTLVTTRVKSPDGGPPAKSSIEIDISAVPSTYLLIVPDYRGRMRPRVISGGQPLRMEDEALDDGSEQP